MEKSTTVGCLAWLLMTLPTIAQPLPGQLLWSWNSSSTEPDSLNVMAAPVVADLDQDGQPEVIFPSTAYLGSGNCPLAELRVLRGSDGMELWTSAAGSVDANSTPAVGDIDGDGLAEIVTMAGDLEHLIAFEHDGTVKWTSDPIELSCGGAPAIGDLDGDGSPEIVIGRQALDAGGTLLWTGAEGKGAILVGLWVVSYPVDLNSDGNMEVVAGNTVYQADGSVLWTAPLPDGPTAVADLDLDGLPEVIHAAAGSWRALDGATGAIVVGPITIPASGRGGPPCVADFDGDGAPEVGIAGGTLYSVFEPDGTLMWSLGVNDGSAITGSSAFDFDDDGKAEVVYSDQSSLYILNGVDGTVRFTALLNTCTWVEYAIVADVNADGAAEIIAPANVNCGVGPLQGISVFEGVEPWAPATRIWNQYTYHGTNVNTDGTIPANEPPHWLEGNTFRAAAAPVVPCVDLNGDDVVDVADLLVLLAAWGPCPECPADIDGDGVVGTADLLALLAAWGPCP